MASIRRQLAEKLAADREHRVKAVCVVHNETSTGVASRIPEIRAAIDAARHPALFMVDTISSLASIDYRHDEWGVDVTVAGSQKGLMLPPGLGFNAISAQGAGRRENREADPLLLGLAGDERDRARPGSSPIRRRPTSLFGLREALAMLLDEEGLPAVFRRHARHAEATRRAVTGWGLEIALRRPARIFEFADRGPGARGP